MEAAALPEIDPGPHQTEVRSRKSCVLQPAPAGNACRKQTVLDGTIGLTRELRIERSQRDEELGSAGWSGPR
jgi:hypothetical protein